LCWGITSPEAIPRKRREVQATQKKNQNMIRSGHWEMPGGGGKWLSEEVAAI